MKKSILLAALCMLTLPLFSSPYRTFETAIPHPFNVAALAGHTHVGAWCECGSSADCFCDPGETPNGIRRQANTNNSELPDEPITEPVSDLGSIALIFAFMALTLFRLRA